MACKHRILEGNTTKYFVCKITGKQVDDYKCNNCMMKIEDTTKEQYIKDIFSEMFGKGFGN